MRFVLKLILKVIVLPIWLILTIAVGVLMLTLKLGAVVLGLASGIIGILGILLLFKSQWVGAILYLIIAYLISPYGLPSAAAWLIAHIAFLKESLGSFLLS